MRLQIVLGIVAAVAVLVAGCGGGGDSATGAGAGGTGATTGGSDGGGKPLSKKEFITQGDAICAKVPPAYQAKVKELEKKAKEPPPKPEATLKAAVPPLYTAIEELEELTPPKGDEQKAEAIIDALEAAAKGLEEKPFSELEGPKSPFAEFQKLTSEYGFEGCNQL